MKREDSEKACELCGVKFWDRSKMHNRRFCSTPCQKKAWGLKNEERVKSNKQKYHQEHKQEIVERVNEWRQNNRDKSNSYRRKYKQKYKTGEIQLSPVEKLKHALRTRVNDVLEGRLKGGSAIQDLGCSPKELMIHLESQFYANPKTGEPMTWQNHGKFGWHIDHIEPLAKFDLENPEEFKVACNYKNLQPLWWFENLAKRDKDLEAK